MEIYSKIPELIDEGIIAIDKQGYIKVYNKMAKEIFGLEPDNSGDGHPEGAIKDGDIVIIVDNMLGADDGGMKAEDLMLIGVNPDKIRQGDAIVAVGKKGAKISFGKIQKTSKQSCDITLNTKIEGIKIKAGIKYSQKRLYIEVEENIYDYKYLWAAGHMVIIDGNTHQIKFYQQKGYTWRKEDIRSILLGKKYRGKGRYARAFDVLNKHILKVHTKTNVIEKLLKTATGCSGDFHGIEALINGIPVRCSIKEIKKDSETLGAMLEIKDITEIKEIERERQQIIKNIKKLKKKIITENIEKQAFKGIIGNSAKMKAVINTAKKVAQTNSTVLLLGESGTGKNLFAEAIHKSSPKKNGPFVYINCASIPENLLESELFGYEKGAFTGAVSEKQGKFEQANLGTIFLDEINELPISLQAKLLHVVQSRRFTRVGGLKPIKVDVRIIAASNKDLDELVAEGMFRRDLFYRINVVSITIPPLRERKEDIYLLTDFIMEKISEKIGILKKDISPEVFKILRDYDWPGNIRELENVLERAMIMSGNVIYPQHLPQSMFKKVSKVGKGKVFLEVTQIGPIKNIVAEAEKKAILKALEIANGNRKQAIELLQMSKTNFYEKMKKLNILREI